MKEDKLKVQKFETLFNKYLKEICSKDEARELLEILEDPTNDQLIKSEAFKVWNEYADNGNRNDSMNEILDELHHRIGTNDREKPGAQFINKRLINFIIRAAAVLFIPLILYSTYVTFKFTDKRNKLMNQVLVQTIKVPPGVQTDFILSDGSHVWLNSGSVFKYPGSFQGKFREVELTGEAYFDISKDLDHPFIVNAGKVNIEVKGTQFVVIDYPEDPQIEVILETGEVSLFKGDNKKHNLLALIKPGEKVTYDIANKISSISKVDVEKYTAWKEGLLIFRSDPITEVVKQLSRKFNVNVELAGPDIEEYIYTATFKNETLIQILDLLQKSAPIKYSIYDQKVKDDFTYSKPKIIISKINR